MSEKPDDAEPGPWTRALYDEIEVQWQAEDGGYWLSRWVEVPYAVCSDGQTQREAVHNLIAATSDYLSALLESIRGSRPTEREPGEPHPHWTACAFAYTALDEAIPFIGWGAHVPDVVERAESVRDMLANVLGLAPSSAKEDTDG